jgi:hypothetical protein
MYNDPTESFRQVELMQAVYHTPYEAFSPYEEGMPPVVPPAPPKRRRRGLLVAWVSLLCVALVLGGMLFGILLASGLQHVTRLPLPPTPVPSATPIPPISVAVSEIYHDFSTYGLAGTNVRADTNWRCCTYAPEGGALVWTDRASGHRLDIATFKSMSEAAIDARQLSTQHFSSTVVQTCLLSYDRAVHPSVLRKYVRVMHAFCH